ncbi:MAG: OmpA family protein [Gemmatimonadetes bacterium]|nr:OmpA family protein [Gemmatimonadota bacterium]NIQ58283.1 OmpA family protein [Gemmatimonadota bacterium]NIU78496.1 OmpA family protein [Gammaproteobacteria bacterium]NIX47380.1 OmpA family protein [Gemmatimonadota bacterium]NIY11753.1 OmpA family protein [Gemmatimonadota bacterium]
MRKVLQLPLAALVVSGMLGLGACSSWSNKAKGGVIGAGAGAAVGAAIGNQVGSTAKGAIVGAAVGGAAGAIIGHQMDQQAKELENEIEGATVTRVGEGIVVTFDTGILFDFDSSALRQQARANLQELAENLREYERTDVLILGHTDATGSDAYNQQLSERRAQSAAGYLEQLGVAPSRVSTRGMGENDPVATNDTAEGRQLNRRVEVVIYADEEWREEVMRQQ